MRGRYGQSAAATAAPLLPVFIRPPDVAPLTRPRAFTPVELLFKALGLRRLAPGAGLSSSRRRDGRGAVARLAALALGATLLVLLLRRALFAPSPSRQVHGGARSGSAPGADRVVTGGYAPTVTASDSLDAGGGVRKRDGLPDWCV